MPQAIKKAVQLPFDSVQFRSLWNDWLNYRRDELKKKSYTIQGLTRTFNTLVRLSNNNEGNAIKIITTAIDNAWQGFHPLSEVLTNEQKKKDFFKKLQDFKSKNSSLYPKQLYQEFFHYWTKEDSLTNQLAFDKVRIFNFEERLKNWYEKTDKEKLSQMWKMETGKLVQLNLPIFRAEYEEIQPK